MMRRTLLLLLFPLATIWGQTLSGDEILRRVDKNMFSESKIVVSRMIIHGERATRTLESKSWQRGTTEAFTDFLAPAREKGTKMLKLKDMLWMYSPSTDRTILISGHMLRQSMMGSDLSYEDMMQDPHLPNLYSATVVSEEAVNGRACWVLDLVAKKEDIAYERRKVWVDKERFVMLKADLCARSGKLLKTIDVREVFEVKGRWQAKSVLYKDVFKDGVGTEFLIDSLELEAKIPDYVFSKAALKQ